ncbi:MAG TPA: ribosome biogenesis GTP-binding protein YihA/YsxC [Steroidobacter sp.]|nr:ribosome biogenesis GTP-binding protein YihA/YsxC [Steroidobacter sp.]
MPRFTAGPLNYPLSAIRYPLHHSVMLQFPEARFLTSAWRMDQCPPDEGAEVAFAGRSNAGKSSALNAITGRKDLARTSKTPGRTQLINFFTLAVDAGSASDVRLVDLPGYGYAKAPQSMKRHWRELMSRYIETRRSLRGLFIVMDARRPLTDFDWQMLEWVRAHELAVHLLLTKADKLSRGAGAGVLQQTRVQVAGAATAQLFSSVDKTGLHEARREVLRMLNLTQHAQLPSPTGADSAAAASQAGDHGPPGAVGARKKSPDG